MMCKKNKCLVLIDYIWFYSNVCVFSGLTLYCKFNINGVPWYVYKKYWIILKEIHFFCSGEYNSGEFQIIFSCDQKCCSTTQK